MAHKRADAARDAWPAWLGVDDAARYGATGKHHMRKLAKTGEVKARRDGRRLIIERDSIDARNERLPKA